MQEVVDGKGDRWVERQDESETVPGPEARQSSLLVDLSGNLRDSESIALFELLVGLSVLCLEQRCSLLSCDDILQWCGEELGKDRGVAPDTAKEPGGRAVT